MHEGDERESFYPLRYLSLPESSALSPSSSCSCRSHSFAPSPLIMMTFAVLLALRVQSPSPRCPVHLEHDLGDRRWGCEDLDSADVVHGGRAAQVHHPSRRVTGVDRIQPAVRGAKVLPPQVHFWIVAIVRVLGASVKPISAPLLGMSVTRPSRACSVMLPCCRESAATFCHSFTAFCAVEMRNSLLVASNAFVPSKFESTLPSPSSLSLHWLCCTTVRAHSRLRCGSPP